MNEPCRSRVRLIVPSPARCVQLTVRKVAIARIIQRARKTSIEVFDQGRELLPWRFVDETR